MKITSIILLYTIYATATGQVQILQPILLSIGATLAGLSLNSNKKPKLDGLTTQLSEWLSLSTSSVEDDTAEENSAESNLLSVDEEQNDEQHNDEQHNDEQHKYEQHNDDQDKRSFRDIREQRMEEYILGERRNSKNRYIGWFGPEEAYTKREVRKKIWDEKIFGNSEAYVSSTIEGEEILMKDPKRVLFLSPDSATAFVNFPCGITRATKEFAKNSVGYGFQKNSPYVALFSYVINDLIEFGNVKYIQSSIAMEKDSMTCEQNKEYKPLGYENIFSVFILLFIGIILSGIKLIYENMSCIYT